ncbi:MAG: energy-coupling factor transporter transmembrane protein EcfT, partial [Enterococcus sp.]|nr:energy-coupling factor transporter transmembrane protein EcfT [Enterococcus sp.]
MEANNVIGYLPKKTPIHQLSGFTKMLSFLMISIVGMISYDTRFLIALAVFSAILFRIAKISYREISFVLKFIAFFSVLNLLTVYLFAPEYGVTIYGSRHVIFEGIGRYTLTQEQLFYELNLLIKYFVTIPPGLI